MYERYQLDVVLRKQTGEAVRRSALYLQTNNKLDFAAFDGIKLHLRLDFDHTCIEEAACASTTLARSEPAASYRAKSAPTDRGTQAHRRRRACRASDAMEQDRRAAPNDGLTG